MSAILLNNPFAAPPPLPNGQATNAEPAIAAIPATSGAEGAKDTVQSRGANTGDGTSKQNETVAIFQKFKGSKRPPDATSDSVISAQASAARDSDAEQLPNAKPEEEPKLGPDLPEVKMPDPLPTSPILLRMRENEGS